MTDTSPTIDPLDAIRSLAEQHRYIVIFWGVDDVKAIRDDLTEEQAWEVLTEVEHNHDAEHGIAWYTLECAANHLFPEDPGSA